MTTAPVSRYLTCLGREIHFLEWGQPDLPPLLMCHGLARTCNDFGELAMALAGSYRIICPDMIGRGLSQWSPDPDAEYSLPFYARILRELLDQLGIDRVRWVGTSMGGATGIVAGATVLEGRISHLVLNDVGTSVASAALERIKSYAGQPASFDTVTELETYLRNIYQPFSWQSDAQWRRLTETSARRLPDGKVTTHYDPAMVSQLFKPDNEYELWDDYDTLDMPVLILRGEHSDLLLPETVTEMLHRGPSAQLIVVPDCGHTPCLNVPEQIDPVRDFLAQ